jgi:phosphoribosylglycinamide formyltransferase-1
MKKFTAIHVHTDRKLREREIGRRAAKPRIAMPSGPLVPCSILVSGSGTNLQAVIDAARMGELPLDVRLVISNRPAAFALERARRAGIASMVLEWGRERESRAEYARRVAAAVRASGSRLVLLLGWMHVLDKQFLDAGFDGVLNLHPAYLPNDPAADTVTLPDGTVSTVFRGAHALRDAIHAKVPMTGATLIEITPEYDRGPVLARRTCALRPDDDEGSALERLHDVEREVVTEGILRWLTRVRS